MGIDKNKILSVINRELDYGIVQWREDPPTFAKLLAEGGEAPTELQGKSISKFFGVNPKKIFNTIYDIALWIWGKGSGKDWLAIRLEIWIIRVLLAMYDAKTYLGLTATDYIDIINVARSPDQANEVFFDRLTKYILNSKYFCDHFSIIKSGEYKTAKGKPILRIINNRVEFNDAGIRLISANANNENYEGYAPIFWIMDEAASFSVPRREGQIVKGDAFKCFKTLQTSGRSRYGDKWKGIIISYPRSKEDFVCQKVVEYYKLKLGESDSTINNSAERQLEEMLSSLDSFEFEYENIVVSKHALWKVRPANFQSGKYFKIEINGRDYEIPWELEKDFKEGRKTDKAQALRMYGAVIIGGSNKLWDGQESILAMTFVPAIVPVVTVKEAIRTVKLTSGDAVKRMAYRVDWWNNDYMNKNFVAHVDLGEKKDSAALCIGYGVATEIHGESGVQLFDRKIIIPGIIVWEPNKKEKISVSFNNILQFLIEFAHKFKLVMVTYDQWQSSQSVETLQDLNITVKQRNITASDYFLHKSLCENGLIECIENPVALLEFKDLLRISENKIDHPLNGSKDVADGICGCCRNISMIDKVLLDLSEFEILEAPKRKFIYGKRPIDYIMEDLNKY